MRFRGRRYCAARLRSGRVPQQHLSCGFQYGRFDSVADLMRQIGYGERVHELESEARLKSARFR